MKIKTIIITGVAALLVTTSAKAERDWSWNWHDRFAYDREVEKFRANELTFDVFGSYMRNHRKFNDAFDRTIRHGTWGGGLGVNYFFLRYVGVGADAFAQADGDAFINNTSASLIGRFPIGDTVAPYVVGGAGRNFDPIEEWTGHVGTGIEFRLNAHTGIFVDGRYVWADKSVDYSLLRAGLRFAF
jgi:hypothetical protein